MITKKECGNWVSIIGKVIFINDERVKIAIVVSGRNNQNVEIFESKLDNEDIKLSFGDKDELISTIFDLKQKTRRNYEDTKKAFNDAKLRYDYHLN